MTEIGVNSSVYNKTLGRWGTVVKVETTYGGYVNVTAEYDGWHTQTGHVSHLVHERDYGVWVEAGDGVECEWFAMCDRPATTTVGHPILGEVPTCDRCAELAKL